MTKIKPEQMQADRKALKALAQSVGVKVRWYWSKKKIRKEYARQTGKPVIAPAYLVVEFKPDLGTCIKEGRPGKKVLSTKPFSTRQSFWRKILNAIKERFSQ